MQTGTELLYVAAGKPELDRLFPRPAGPCGMCGGTFFNRGRPLNDTKIDGCKIEGWLKPTFTGYPEMKAHSQAAWICEGCLFSLHEKATIPGREARQKMRNYSHFVEGTTWTPCTKAEEGREFVLSFLTRPHQSQWLACVATSGQKHLIFRTPVNAPNGDLSRPVRVQVEEQFFSIVPDELVDFVRRYEEMYTAFSKTEIDSGNYSAKRIMEFGGARFLELENYLKNFRGSGLFALAGFLAIRRDADGRKVSDGECTGTADGDSATTAGSVPVVNENRIAMDATGGLQGDAAERPARCAEAAPGSGRESVPPLGQNPSGDGIASTADSKREGVAGARPEKAANTKPRQLALFDF